MVVALFTKVDDLFITSALGDSKVRVGPFDGAEILDCFGYGDRADAKRDHLVLLLVAVVADAATGLAFALRAA